ncbi:hypothetical protein HDE76_000671 [Rhodanobacter sp. ANJX3]|nr:hypothetical protein [Rhodanobacter sp. ANJX3]
MMHHRASLAGRAWNAVERPWMPWWAWVSGQGLPVDQLVFSTCSITDSLKVSV